MNEFDIIRKFFLPLTMERAEAAHLSDDAAVLAVPQGYEMVISSDTLSAGTHFHNNESPANIARKALRANLSDMAAMGAKPLCYQLNIALPDAPDEGWLAAFTEALLEDNTAFDVFCSGGDTTRTTGPLLISITMTGLAPAGQAVTRSGANPGDLAIVTGTIGVACAADYRHIPTPRTALSTAISQYANAAIDISDGLAADLQHLCTASNVGAQIELENIPLAESTLSPADLLSGGDDYEILMAVDPKGLEPLTQAAAQNGVKLSVIGTFTENKAVEILDQNAAPLTFERTGWTHF